MLQPQIVQSPARLGLSNPNSPAFQNPTPPKLPLQQQPSSSASASSSSQHSNLSPSLLSLLSPLPRAQSLLVQMASLASKLFEVSPNRSLWLNAFRGSFPTFLSSQTQSQFSIPLENCPSSTKDVLSQFTALQTQLFEAVAELQEILDLQDAKLKIAHEVRSKDVSLLAFSKKLKDVEQVLDNLVDDYSDLSRPKRVKLDDGSEDDSSCTTTVSSQLNLSDILSYAHRISYTTFAPPEFGAGQAPLRGSLPPAPQEEHMRASQLYNFANLDVGLPKTVDSTEKTIEAIMEPPHPAPTEANQAPNFGALQGRLPPNITIPSGWKPGMPVELPTDFPMPPPGWKPGDPVPLPPVGSLPVPKVEDQHLRPKPQAMHKPQEPIQVMHVELDIPDQDDSSDYSSDEGSFEDDD
ncbi:mediator of RNA polymerase II transcription subunit 4-like [Rosa rugosa]|uniref:mediator of RNA polymerase II transcription subunit 4-like n=1 Tax=Rosa rugosa TaxID=74645 RepID=UPI002B402F23|nr:mediator of RNA polymerase II transcription subunit 4-like [Rosa rugosa]XP_061998079.1 mediator of RNA polymerase II transcription subunit 4-like [Rosa rugosa]XP_061998080.1 mediator of RNA polymerase II transcription subunit 4-like [Rosa rugosa]